MTQAFSSRLERLCARVAAAFWLGGLVLLWAMLRPEPRPLAATLLGSYFLAWGTALVLAPPPRSRVIARFTLMTSALSLPSGFLELLSTAGLADFRSLFNATGIDPRHHADNVPDPELGHIHRPYLKRTGVTRGDIASALHLTDTPLHPYDVTYDRYGFRNARDLSTAEVVVLGDSFVEGGLVATDDLMTAILGRLLGCSVANLGQSGYGPQQELVVLKRYAAPLRPRLCIWTFYEGNDLDDVARFESPTQGDGRSTARSTYRERSFARNALRALSCRFGRILASDAADRTSYGLFQDEDGRPLQLYFRGRCGPLRPRELAALDDVVAILTAAHAACGANRMPLLVVFSPQKYRVYKDHCTIPPGNPCARWAIDDLPERLRTRVAAINPEIGFLDLTPALTAEAARGHLLYFADDTHWSAEGHQTAGRAIAAEVTRRGFLGLPSRSSPGRGEPLDARADHSRRR